MRIAAIPAIVVLGAACIAAACSPFPPAANPAGEPAPNSRYLRKDPKREAVIVFIHGVFGNVDTTWKHTKATFSWPELVEHDSAFSDSSVYVVSYGSPFLKQSSNIEEIAQRLLQQFVDQDVLSHKRIYVIAHSMGGLIAKRMLTALNTPSRVQELRRVRTVLFLSTPAQGAPPADVASFISMNPQLKDMQPADLNTFLQTLENSWNDLLRERDKVRELYPRAFCAYETLATSGIHIVSRVYANSRCDNNPYAMDFDHSQIVKPIDDKTDPYAWVKSRISDSDRLGVLNASAKSAFDSVLKELLTLPKQAQGDTQITALSLGAIGDGYTKAAEFHGTHIAGIVGEREKASLSNAVNAYSSAARLDPLNSTYPAKIGITFMSAGQPKDAIRSLQKAIALDPTIAWYHSELCTSYSKAGDVAQALPSCRAALRLQPTNAEYQKAWETAVAYDPKPRPKTES